jgi:hypothetical protein
MDLFRNYSFYDLHLSTTLPTNVTVLAAYLQYEYFYMKGFMNIKI